MIRLRPYKPSDAWALLEWWEGAGEEAFVMWSAGKFDYPLTIEQLDAYFSLWCLRDDSGWLMTALDESGRPAGHFILRMTDYEKNEVRMGFIVTDPKTRGRGTGREMVRQALKYIFDVLGMERVTLVVFADNAAARKCYESCGFTVKRDEEVRTAEGKAYAGLLMEAVRPSAQ